MMSYNCTGQSAFCPKSIINNPNPGPGPGPDLQIVDARGGDSRTPPRPGAKKNPKKAAKKKKKAVKKTAGKPAPRLAPTP
jgi:hypothetical protein